VINLNNIIEDVLCENANVAGGAGSVLGPGVASTETHNSGDFYAPNDARAVKPLGLKPIKRNFPKDSLYSGCVKSKSRRKHRRHKKKH
jgi:hypothetical protein